MRHTRSGTCSLGLRTLPGEVQNSQPSGKKWLKNTFALFRDQDCSGSHPFLGSFWELSPIYRYHSRAVCVVQSCSASLHQSCRFLPIFPHQGLPESKTLWYYLQPPIQPHKHHAEKFGWISLQHCRKRKIPQNTSVAEVKISSFLLHRPCPCLNHFFKLRTFHVLV